MLMPTLFIAHGSPMNALGGNSYASWLSGYAHELPQPRACLVVSAHWETAGTQVLDLEHPPTIHDFFGFPPELYQIRYPAPGFAALTGRVVELLGPKVSRSKSWGLDHGAWSVLTHLYPKANIPVVQLSLATGLDLAEHYEVGRQLKALRSEGVLILGSGNIVHNLRQFSMRENAAVAPWSADFDQKIEQALKKHDLDVLLRFKGIDPSLARQAVPTAEHYQPLLYALGASEPQEKVSFPFAEIQNASISMRCVRFG